MCVFAFLVLLPPTPLNLRISNLHDGVNINFYPLCNNIGFSIDSRPRQVGCAWRNFGKTAECEMYDDDDDGGEEVDGPDR
jgi:hypothetical protein